MPIKIPQIKPFSAGKVSSKQIPEDKPKTKGKPSNPNKANQFVPDPRQALFLDYYLNPKSATFSNALQSALKAGYSQEYAENITRKEPEWLAEKGGTDRRLKMLDKAENNLEEFLEMETENCRVINGVPYTFKDSQLVRVKQDTAKFVAKTIGREFYAEKAIVDVGETLEDILKERRKLKAENDKAS